jgi:hypothetical protein
MNRVMMIGIYATSSRLNTYVRSKVVGKIEIRRSRSRTMREIMTCTTRIMINPLDLSTSNHR